MMADYRVPWGYLLLIVLIATAIVAPFLYAVSQRRSQVAFLRQRRRYLDTLIQGAQGMTMVRDLTRLLNLIVHILSRTVRVDNAAIWLFDPKSSQYVLHAFRAGNGFELGNAIHADSPLIRYLTRERRPLARADLQAGLQRRQTDGAELLIREMEHFKAALIIPSFVHDRMIGFVTLSRRKKNDRYSPEDLEVFQVLSSQAALAIENARFYENLKATQAELFQTAKMASLGHMAGGMSHQINNRFHVLTILAGTVKSMMKGVDPAAASPEQIKELWEKALETFGKIEDNALRGGDIVKTLLRFSRPSGEYKPVMLQEIFNIAREVAQFRVNMGMVDFIEEIPADLPAVKGDLNQLADSCFNLITNAYDAIQRKATMLEEKHLSPAPNDPIPFRGKIWIRARVEKREGRDWILLELQDNGIGMTPQELDNLFVPFFTTKATAQKGTGLGLYVIQRILERHGGNIAAASTYGAGTTFTLRLPAHWEKAPAAIT